MKKSIKKQFANILFVVILASITIVTLLNSNKELNFSSLKSFFYECNIFYIIASFVCMLAFVLFEALSLKIILRKLGCKTKIASALAYSSADVYYSAITPSATGGQPASAYYMIKDGVSGGASGFSLIFNLVGYTLAILIIGIVALFFRFDMFLQFTTFVKFLVVFGIVAQVFLLGFFIGCMCWHTQILKIGRFFVSLLHNVHIIKDKEKWLARVERAVEKYRCCYDDFQKHKFTFLWVLLCNIAQRVSQMMVSVFVCKSAIDCSMWEIFIMQSFVLVGYNSIPLPGGIGAYEYLYLQIYGLALPKSFIVVAVMVTRAISYYISMLVSGIYTVAYHLYQNKISKRNKQNCPNVLHVKEDQLLSSNTNVEGTN